MIHELLIVLGVRKTDWSVDLQVHLFLQLQQSDVTGGLFPIVIFMSYRPNNFVNILMKMR